MLLQHPDHRAEETLALAHPGQELGGGGHGGEDSIRGLNGRRLLGRPRSSCLASLLAARRLRPWTSWTARFARLTPRRRLCRFSCTDD
jgi:hypothetical protein